MATLPIPLTELGLYGGHNLSGINPGYLLQAENIAFDDGCLRKEGGASIYNSVIPVAFVEQSNPKNFALSGVAWNGTIMVAVGAADGTDSYIVTSVDGVTWTERAPTVAKNLALNDVCWSSQLLLFVAVGVADGTDGYILTSPDGVTWTERANPKNFALNEVVWAAGTVDLFVAVGAADGTDAYIITSPDGTNWNERANPKNFDLNGITWDGTTFAAVGAADGTDSYIVTSTTGTTWTERAPTVAKNIGLNSAIWDPAAALFVAVGAADGTDAYILTSPDGTTWTERSNPKNFALNALTSDGTFIIAVGAADGTDSYVVTSVDGGITWVERANPKNFALNDVVWNGIVLVAIGAADGTDAYIVNSGSIFSFTDRTNPKDFALRDVAFSGQIYVAIGAADGTDAYLITSTDLVTWTERSNPANIGLFDVIWSGQKFVAVGAAMGSPDYAYIITSDDGITWTERANPKEFQLNGIVYNGVTFVAVGQADGTDAYLVTSPDGVTWTERSNPQNISLNAVTWTGDLFVAVGNALGGGAGNPYIITSPDGITWTQRTAPTATGAALLGVAWNGSLLAAVGTGAQSFGGTLIATSPDGITWTQRYSTSASTATDITWNGKTFMATAAGEIIFSVNGIVWQSQPTPTATTLRGVIWDGLNFVFVGDNTGTDAIILSMDYNQVRALGAAYWDYNGSSPKVVMLDLLGRLLMDNYDGNFDTVLASSLTVTADTFPVFVEGGKEVAANNKKLFIFTGANIVQVLSGSATSTANLTTPPADWTGATQPTGGLIHDSRLWGYGNSNDPHRLYYTGTTNHEDFSLGGSITVYPGQGEKIVNAISYKGYIIVFKYPKGIYIVDTTSVQVAGWRVNKLNEHLGGAGQGSAAVVEEDLIFIDHTGEIRTLSGITEYGDIGSRSVSDMHDISVFIRDNYYLPSNTQWRMQYYSKKRELHIGASSNFLGVNDNRMVIDFNRSAPRFRNSTRDNCLYLFTRELDGAPELMHCDNLGNIWRMDQEDRNKDGLGYESTFQITYTDFGDPTAEKNGESIEIAYEPTGDVELLIDVFWDGVFQETTSMALDAPATIQPGRMTLNKEVPLVGSGQRLSLTCRNNDADQDFAIQGMWIHYSGAGDTEEP